jgi:hypothetical protein
MTKPDRTNPILIGTVVTYAFVENVQESVVKEREKLRLFLSEAYQISEEKSSSV